MLDLRPYQRAAVDRIYAALQERANVLLVAIMGAGKTAMATNIAELALTDRPETRVLVLAHKEELLNQFRKAFAAFTSIPPVAIGVSCAGLNERDIRRVITVASVQTFVNQVDDYEGAGLIIIDECHRVDVTNDSMYSDIITKLRQKRPNCRILGITATPFRLGHGYIYGPHCKRGNENLFDQVDHRITYAELVALGFLMPMTGVAEMSAGLDEDLATVDKVAGEYNLGQLGTLMGRTIHVQNAVAALRQHGEGCAHVVAFCCTIDHAEAVYQAMLAAGESCTIVHSKLTKEQRRANMRLWESGAVRVVSSVNILAEGYDFPAADCELMLRPTASPALLLQALGRIARIHPGKDRALVIDCTANLATFGTDLDNIRATIPGESSEASLAAQPEKVCPQCAMGNHPAVRECPGCGYQFGQETVPDKYVPQLTEVTFEPYQSKRKEYAVEGMTTSIHNAKSGKKLLRVDLCLTTSVISHFPIVASIWICLADYYDGFAVKKGEEKWRWFSVDDFPETVEEAYEIARDWPDYLCPVTVFVDEKPSDNPRFPNLDVVEIVMPAECDRVAPQLSTVAIPDFIPF